MTGSTFKLPLGIRNNNPGNLRSNVGMDYPTVRNRGFAVFRSMDDGLKALATLIWRYGLCSETRTPFGFISRYAPASENDLHMYVSIVCRTMGIASEVAKTADMCIEDVTNATNLMRAIIHVENGYAPRSVSVTGEWFGPQRLLTALVQTGHWQVKT